MEFLHPHPRRLTHPTSHSLVGHTALDEPQLCQPSRFLTSADRLEWPESLPRPAPYDPLGSLAQDEPTLARKALCSSFSPRFFPTHIARGVLSDGTWTTAHPSVHAFLQDPSSRPSLTSKTSAAIYSLAALHVFYSPSHPAYDAFWHPDIKEGTASFVHQVVTMEPSPISTAPMTWLGVHDMLWQLTGIQKEYFKSQGVKTIVEPPLPTRRSLRKRKPVQALLQELSTREPSEVIDEPPRKKNKISKPEGNEKGSEATVCVVLDQSDVSTNNKAGPSELPPNKSRMSSSHDTHGNVDVTPSPLTITSSLPSESHSPAKDDVAQAGTSRGRSKDAVGKKAQVKPASSRSSVRRTRDRSPSFSSGSSTAVSAAGGNTKRARSSSSASSTSTTVVAETGTNSSSKGKGKAKADVIPEEETEAEEVADEEKAGKRSTRSRRSSAREAAASKPPRKQGGTTSLRTPVEIDKLVIAEAPPRRVRSRSGVTSSRSRKSRKS